MSRKKKITKDNRPKRVELFAYASNEFQRVVHFTRHFSQFSAEKHYGDLSRRYRGGARSDFYLAVVTREEMVRDFSSSYDIDWKKKTITPKKEPSR